MSKNYFNYVEVFKSDSSGMKTRRRMLTMLGELSSKRETKQRNIQKAKVMGWSKSSFRFVYKMLWENPNELFDQPIK